MALLLAAGEGTRMKSKRPKVMHTLCGKPMITWVLDALEELKSRGLLDRVVAVIGKGASEVREEVGERALCVVQEERLGTGHAVMVAAPAISEDEVLVLAADSPLVTAATLARLCEVHEKEKPAATVLAVTLDDPTGYGRILRDADGRLRGIVEETEAGREEREIREVNTSTYIFSREALKEALERLGSDNAKGEYFLSDVPGLLAAAGRPVAVCASPGAREFTGINSREQLARAEAMMRERINRRWMEEGVTMEDPSTAYIGAWVKIGRDTLIRPGVVLEGQTVIGEECVLGPGVRIADSRLGNGVVVEQAVVRESEIGDGVTVGPYASLRPGSRLGKGSKAGTFVETKNTVLGEGSKVPHLSYMGDAEIGDGVNVGAGSITCNYDGVSKHRTVIEDGAFIGSDTMFVAPVHVGKGAVTGAGSAITKDVPPGSLGIERSEQRNILQWKKKGKKKER